MKKHHTSVYITQKLKDLMKFLVEREDIPQTLFLKRALKMYLAGSKDIDARVLITERTHPDYIRRDVPLGVYIDLGQWKELERTAAEKGCNASQEVFQALVEYCASLAGQDMRGITVINNEKD